MHMLPIWFLLICVPVTHKHSPLLCSPFYSDADGEGMMECQRVNAAFLEAAAALSEAAVTILQLTGRPSGPAPFPISADQAAKKKKESLPGRNNQRSRAEALPGRPLWFASRRGMFLTPSPAPHIPLYRSETTAGQRLRPAQRS